MRLSFALSLGLLLTALPCTRTDRDVGGDGAEDDAEYLASTAATAWSGPEANAYRLLVKQHWQEVRDALAPLVAVVPTNPKGRLDGSAAKYVLHHFFVRRFAWHIEGLDPEGQFWNTTSLTEVKAMSRMPAVLHDALTDRLAAGGLFAGDVTELALCIWHVLNSLATEKLVKTYASLGYARNYTLDLEEAVSTLSRYKAAFLSNSNRDTVQDSTFAKMDKLYPRWHELVQLVRDLVTAVHTEQGGGQMEFEAVDLARSRVDERYGIWQAPECRDLKQLLLAHEDAGSGRVRLADFYAAGLHGHFQFTESVSALQLIGALENSGEEKVLIENYVSGPSNAIGSTPFHDVRCISDCEMLYDKMERLFAAPAANPDDIAAFVAGLPSATVPAPRTLSSVQLQRLTAIAVQDGGQVPISGRMLALWMHAEYPRECPFPHLANTTQPMALMDILKTTELMESKTKMQDIVNHPKRRDGPMQFAPWKMAEELPATMQQFREQPLGLLQMQFGVLLVIFVLVARLVFATGGKISGRARAQKSGPRLAS